MEPRKNVRVTRCLSFGPGREGSGQVNYQEKHARAGGGDGSVLSFELLLLDVEELRTQIKLPLVLFRHAQLGPSLINCLRAQNSVCAS